MNVEAERERVCKVSCFKMILRVFKCESSEYALQRTAYFAVNVIKGRHKGRKVELKSKEKGDVSVVLSRRRRD